MSEKMLFTGERYIPEYFSDSNDEIVKEHEDRYKTITELITDKVVLDAACGSGYGSFEISKHAKSIIGIDISEDSVAYAKNNFLAENLNFEVASVTEIPFDDNEFEVVVSFETIEHISENQQVLFLKQIKRVLKEDGILIISTPDKLIYSDKKNYKNEFHIKEFYEKEFYCFLSNFFKNVEFYYQKQEVCNLIYNKDSLEVSFSTNSEEISGKYIIAICSDIDLKALKKIGSISIEDTKNDFLNTRILSLQDEVNEKNQWAFNLNSEINKINLILEEKENKYLRLEEEKSQIEFSLKSQLNNLKQELEEKENDFSSDRIKNLEEELYKIYTSSSWKIMRFPRLIFRIIKNLKRK